MPAHAPCTTVDLEIRLLGYPGPEHDHLILAALASALLLLHLEHRDATVRFWAGKWWNDGDNLLQYILDPVSWLWGYCGACTCVRKLWHSEKQPQISRISLVNDLDMKREQVETSHGTGGCAQMVNCSLPGLLLEPTNEPQRRTLHCFGWIFAAGMVGHYAPNDMFPVKSWMENGLIEREPWKISWLKGNLPEKRTKLPNHRYIVTIVLSKFGSRKNSACGSSVT